MTSRLDVASRRQIGVFPQGMLGIALSPDSQSLAAVAHRSIRIWSVEKLIKRQAPLAAPP